jgi:UDP-N-acetylglucosamine--N-acetylmuramyl-(pentapeptide) pyrophosphoryl-undecaprenol N-acetylglucosamine transferase
MQNEPTTPRVAIACGGTGGHLFPGLAVAEQLKQRGCAITLLISPKEVDQQSVKTARDMRIETLPAVGLVRGSRVAFLRGCAQSYRAARKLFKQERPEAVLAMGGFTSAPPVLAGKFLGARTFLHESNTIPGRANRWLSRVVQEAFVGFPEAGKRLSTGKVTVTGTPVRPEFRPADAAACRVALGLDPNRPVLLVTGGSQGASGLNDLVISMLPLLAKQAPEVQLFHLTGSTDADKVTKACAANNIRAVVHPFFADMHVALGAASAVISRAGASSLAELAAMELPAVLVPFPAAMDNHQHFNALALERTGAALLVEQKQATPESLAAKILELIRDGDLRAKMRVALQGWQAPRAAEQIADSILRAIAARRDAAGRPAMPAPPNTQHHQSIAA